MWMKISPCVGFSFDELKEVNILASMQDSNEIPMAVLCFPVSYPTRPMAITTKLEQIE